MGKAWIQPLDIVRTPKGAVAVVKEVTGGYPDVFGGRPQDASLEYLGGGNPTGEKNAWWSSGEGLIVIDSLPWLMARTMAHPHGDGQKTAGLIFDWKNRA